MTTKQELAQGFQGCITLKREAAYAVIYLPGEPNEFGYVNYLVVHGDGSVVLRKRYADSREAELWMPCASTAASPSAWTSRAGGSASAPPTASRGSARVAGIR